MSATATTLLILAAIFGIALMVRRTASLTERAGETTRTAEPVTENNGSAPAGLTERVKKHSTTAVAVVGYTIFWALAFLCFPATFTGFGWDLLAALFIGIPAIGVLWEYGGRFGKVFAFPVAIFLIVVLITGLLQGLSHAETTKVEGTSYTIEAGGRAEHRPKAYGCAIDDIASVLDPNKPGTIQIIPRGHLVELASTTSYPVTVTMYDVAIGKRSPTAADCEEARTKLRASGVLP